MVGITDSPARARVIDLRGVRRPAQPASVLADPSGRRARRLRVAGRVLGSLFLLWLCGLVLAGLGLLPVSDVPLAGSLRAADEPAQVPHLPSARRPTGAGLELAQPLSEVRDAVAGAARSAGDASATGAGRRSAATRAQQGATGAGHRDALTSRARGTGANGAGSHASHRSPASPSAGGGSTATTPSTGSTSSGTTHGNGHAYGGGGATAPSSGSGTTRGQSATPHGSSASAPGHTRTSTAHGRPAG
jgi:hypothetical protein